MTSSPSQYYLLDNPDNSSASQSQYSIPSRDTDTPKASGSTQPKIRPLPQLPAQLPPTVRLVPTLTSRTSQEPVASNPVVTPVPQPVRPSQESLHPGSHYRGASPPRQTTSNPPVTRYHHHHHQASSDRTSYATTGTTPSLSSSSRTRASQATSDVLPPNVPPSNVASSNAAPLNLPPPNVPSSNVPPPKDMERSVWATAPPNKPPTSQPKAAHQYTATGQPRATSQDPAPAHRRAASEDHAYSNDAWNESMGQISSRRAQQGGYQMETSTSSRSVEHTSQTQVAYQPTKLHKLQRSATSAPSAPEVSYYYYDRTPPLISENTRLTELKEDYRYPGSERSEIIRRKINYLRFELGYRGLRRARGDGNCFYRCK